MTTAKRNVRRGGGVADLGTVAGNVREAGDGPEPPAVNGEVNTLSNDALIEEARSRGIEVHKPRRRPSVIDRGEDVRDKKRLTIYLPTELRQTLEYARIQFDCSRSQVVEDALVDLLHKHNIRVPDYKPSREE